LVHAPQAELVVECKLWLRRSARQWLRSALTGIEAASCGCSSRFQAVSPRDRMPKSRHSASSRRRAKAKAA